MAQARRSTPLGRLRARLSVLAEAHAEALRRSLRWPPWSSLACVLVLGLVLALPAIAHFLLGALATLEARLAARPEWLLFPEPGREPELEALAARLGADPRVAELRRRSAEENLAELLAMPGFAGVAELLAENPLPPVLLLAPRPELTQAEREALRAELAARPELAGVLPAADGRDALRALSARLRLLLAPFALVVALGALAVLFAVLRLSLLERSEELEILRLLGAEASFVQRPYLYRGLWLGALAGALAAAIARGALARLGDGLAALARDEELGAILSAPTLGETLAMVAVGAGLGLFAARLVVRAHLARLS